MIPELDDIGGLFCHRCIHISNALIKWYDTIILSMEWIT